MHRLIPLALATLAGLLASPAAGQPTSGAPVLHEYIPDEADLRAFLEFARRTGAGKLPPGFRLDGDVLKRPEDGAQPKPKEPTHGPVDRDTQRHDRAAPDRNTRHDGQLRYHAVFNPSVVPFKRVSALDAVDSRFVLKIKNPRYRTERLTPVTRSPDRMLFWGSVLLRGPRGQKLALPSVAPDMSIHGYETVPRGIKVTFWKDGADNFAVTVSRGGPVRLKFLVSAPNRYFSHGVPPTLTLADIPAARRPSVPQAVAQVADRMHRRLTLDRSLPLATLIDRMVAHFRGFEEGPLAVNTGNTYEDLTVSQRGVCRHRSYAFVITALALGIPARYITNEAHAFVEVWIPRVGWVRIDLGGAADELTVTGAADRMVHRPLEDPFPKPPAYRNNYSRLNGPVQGLTPRQRRGPQPRDGHGASRRLTPGPDGVPDPRASSPGPTPTQVATVPVSLAVTTARTSGLRGKPLIVTGRISHGQTGAALGRRPVEVLLRRPDSRDMIILGETITAADGSFKLETTIPLAASVGVYRVVAYSPADRKYQAGWSE